MSDGPLMLGVSGMRGMVGSSLTPTAVANFAGTFADWLGGSGLVVLGRDGRAGGEGAHSTALGALLASGASVVDAGVAMTPTIGVLGSRLRASGAIVVTASHNPQAWNGLKLLARAPGTKHLAAPDAGRAREIIDRYRSEPPALKCWDGVGRVRPLEVDPVRLHVEAVAGRLDEIGLLAPIRRARLMAVVDSVNASGAPAAAALLDVLKVRLVAMGDAPTGLFPHEPEPIESNLRSLGRRVRRERAHVGFAQDPDGDRLAIIDERGRFIGEEYTLVVAARALLGARGRAKPAFAANLSTSRMIDDVAASASGRVVRTPVGEANVVEGLLRESCVMGGEGNGGVIWPGVALIRDSLSAAGLALGLMAKEGRPIGEILADFPTYAIRKRKTSLASREEADPVLEAIARAHASARVDTRDGVRVDWADAWLHVRASNTEPILRLIAEAPDAARAESILDEAERIGRGV